MRLRRAPRGDALRTACVTLACLVLTVALVSCRRPPDRGSSIHADDASTPPPDTAGGPPDAAPPPTTVPPPGPPAGPLLGADIRATCVLEHNVVRRWGVRITKQIGNPVSVTFPEEVTRLACASDHVCVLTARGAVVCFGYDNVGQLGLPTSACAARPGHCSDMPPAEVPGLPKIIDLAVGGGATCVLSEAGEVYCWGPGAWIGMTDADDPPDAQLVSLWETVYRVPGLANVRRIAVGNNFGCALDARGDVWCWGSNEYGELGRGTISKRSVQPERVPSLHGVSAIAAIGSGACALASGDLYCWGRSALGDHVEARCKDDWPCTPHPHRMPVPATAPLVALSPLCVLDAQGAAYCWGGDPNAGQPWDAGACGSDCVRPARRILGIPPLSQIAESGLHVCGISTAHELVCWGNLESTHLKPTEKPACAGCESPLFRSAL